MQAFRWAWLLATGLPLWASPALAQLSDAARVSLITLYPGEAVHTLWGHSALRIHDPVLGFDIAYNYGTFDFGNPLTFMARFAYGKLDYQLSRQHYPALVNQARLLQGRTVIEQHLNLSHPQRGALLQFLEHNARPENRTYRYDFLSDNCSTRILDLFTEVLGLERPSTVRSQHSYRELLHPYAAEKSWLSLGIHTGMGLPADQPAEDRSFLPLELMDIAESMSSGSGPLVLRTDTLFMARQTTRHAFPWAVMVAWLALAGGVAISLLGNARTKRIYDRILFVPLGMAGLLITFLWVISLHTVTRPNLLILWIWPTHAVIPWWKVHRRWLRVYHLLAGILAAGFTMAWPLLPQGLPAPMLPIALLVSVRSLHRSWTPVPRTGFEPVLPA